MDSLPDLPPTARRRSSEQLVQLIYEELGIPQHERERHFDAVARLLEQRRPTSWLSATSTQCSGASSKRSTQASFASSHTDYSSNSFNGPSDSLCLPAVAEETNDSATDLSLTNRNRSTGNSLSRRLQKRFSPTAASLSSRDPSSTPGPTDDSASNLTKDASRRRWCPWCQQIISRPNDFKKHVLNYCCGTKFFVCRNQACQNRVSQEKQANIHRRDSEDVICRQHGWSKLELQCKRQHFGCGFCAVYFNNVEAFIDHFGGTCRPDRVRGHWQRSRQIRALLQQPTLLPIVEALCHEYRGHSDAYLGLWWTWRTHRMEKIIRKLEYGPKAKVDDQHPGMPNERVTDFLRDLIRPSAGSQRAADLVEQPMVPMEVTMTSQPGYEEQAYADTPMMEQLCSPVPNNAQVYLHHQTNGSTDCEQHPPPSWINPSRHQYQPPTQFFQPHAISSPTYEQPSNPSFDVLAMAQQPPPLPQQPNTLPYDWNGMMIDDRNETWVDTQWIDQEFGQQRWNPGMH